MSLFKRRDRDPVADQLRSLARQGSGMAKVAHLFSALLIILFSLASLIALGREAWLNFDAARARGGVDIPDGISLAVVLLVVPAFDAGMLYAASTIRLMATRRAETRAMRVHIAVIVLTCLVEGVSYIYMSFLYEHPTSIPAWAIISVRGLTAPLLAVYLAMARSLPVTPRDILYQAELEAGKGVLRDVALAASDTSASLDEKMSLYGAAAQMTQEDRWRLDSMIDAVRVRTPQQLPAPITPIGGRDPLAESGVRTPSIAESMGTETVVSLPVRTPPAEVRRRGQRAIREERIERIVGWLREAHQRGHSLSVRTVRMRLTKIERPKEPISESTVLNLMRLAQQRIDAEGQAEQQAAQ